jgi:glycine oxidase
MSAPDCVVVGGGVMGCAIALRLAQAGVKTTVLERAIPGAEASSAAAGILAAQEESRAPGPLAELNVRSRALFPALADELRAATGIDVMFRANAGVLSVGDLGDLEERYAWQRDRGWRVLAVRGPDLKEIEPNVQAEAGLHFPDDGQIDPRLYARALSLAAARAGAEFVSGAYVRRVTREADRVTGVELEDRVIPAKTVVVAAGSWSALVDGAGLATGQIRPVRGQIALLETRPPAVRGTIVTSSISRSTPSALGPSDLTPPAWTAMGGGYVCGRTDGRVLAGSTMELAGFDKRVTAGGLRHILDLAIRLVPALADAPVVDTWANFRPRSPDELPILGPVPGVPGLILATGHFRNGILLSPVTAEIIKDLVVGSAPDLGPFTLAARATRA